MTLKMTQPPVHEIWCDRQGCRSFVKGLWPHDVRREAGRRNWQLRPARGKGSRSAPDFCPDHVDSAP